MGKNNKEYHNELKSVKTVYKIMTNNTKLGPHVSNMWSKLFVYKVQKIEATEL